MNESATDLSLICRVHERLCALPVMYVAETMRPLPIEALAGAPHFVLGLALIRGAPIPVVDLALLLGAKTAVAYRFVVIIVGSRRIALAVDNVLGVRKVLVSSLHQLPPLLKDTGADIVAAMGMLDAELLLVLNAARLLPEDSWTAGAAESAAITV